MKPVLFFIAIFFTVASLANSENIQLIRLSKDAFLLRTVQFGTNIGLIDTAQGVVLIDPMPGKEYLPELNRRVKQLFGAPAAFILNTHLHDDHTAGNAFFTENGSVLLKDTYKFSEIEEFTVSSHSPRDSIFFHKTSNSIFVGDIYDTSWHPTFYAGGLAGFNHAIDTILRLGDERSVIVPGHGKPTGKAEIRAFQRNTLAWVARFQALKASKMTATDMRHDETLKTILHKFNLENKSEFIPEKAFVRFIERTLTVIDKGV